MKSISAVPKNLRNSYEVLSDEEKREIYNKYGEEGLKQHAANGGRGGGGGMNMQDIFSQSYSVTKVFFVWIVDTNEFGYVTSRFFGGGGSMEEEEKVVKGDDVIVELEATLEDLYMGGSMKVWREKNVIKPAPGKRKCNCRDEVYHRQIGPGMFQQMTEQVCDKCPNVKFEREGYFVTVDIEKGMKDGEEVSFYEDGEPILDGEPGDLKFRIKTAPHARFRRDGNDLHMTVNITLVEALVGFEKSFKHLDDHEVDISSKGITKPKEVKKFKGEGIPLHFSTKKGNLFVTFEGDDVIVELEATLEDLYMGGSMKVWREKNVIKPAPGKRKCNCRDEVYHRQIGPGMFQQMTEQVCDKCPNVKFEREGYFVTVDIEKGMKDGEEVSFYEDGEPILDGEPGDLKFRIKTAPHARFRRDGNDLHMTVNITLVEALVGFEKSFKHLDEHEVDISSKGITKPKEVKKFKGEGMPLHFSTKKGNLFVTFEVLFPSSLTEDQKKKIKEVLA
ncbi:hypothetical protein F2Q68_00045245 [Brassica cretica]|uniref:Chaperone DnaJ C-terminal domain-containing protein n=1 Tax=Brassica cretica TaxID=69181 RepID=A0A8S9LI77_BRACR|nr:hypothetical protein F2Q68_00045245 [Brassica cretica]